MFMLVVVRVALRKIKTSAYVSIQGNEIGIGEQCRGMLYEEQSSRVTTRYQL